MMHDGFMGTVAMSGDMHVVGGAVHGMVRVSESPHSCDGAGRGGEESGRSFTTAAADRGRVPSVSHAAAGEQCGDTRRGGSSV